MKFGTGIYFNGEKVLKIVSTLYPDLRGQGGDKQGLEIIYSLNCETRQKIYKTKVVGKVCFSGCGSYFWACNPDLEEPGPHVLLEPWSIIFRQSLLNKRCSTLVLTFLATFALTIYFIIFINDPDNSG